ncbi:hypothetical protein QBC40DRAFT_256160 [Triangularia verruculosa]|uniref:Uncharacterized protein n=1 Tax=Triangularia verruculosa TaxID=2587418 RepID=A0AAN6XCU5_9PEZI|nr:hypothetical protein QBC40DRAFT_256160 [Triangularia verruculosa]
MSTNAKLIGMVRIDSDNAVAAMDDVGGIGTAVENSGTQSPDPAITPSVPIITPVEHTTAKEVKLDVASTLPNARELDPTPSCPQPMAPNAADSKTGSQDTHEKRNGPVDQQGGTNPQETESIAVQDAETERELVEKRLLLERAVTCTEHVSNAEDFRISVFCDGSAGQDPVENSGGFAVTINKYHPGTQGHGERIGVAWPMEIVLSSSNAEGAAILQGIRQVHQELTEMFTCRDIPKELLPQEKLVIDLYSDGESVIISIAETKRKIAAARGKKCRPFTFPDEASVAKHLSMEIVEEEKRLRELCARLNIKHVEVHYHFVHGHTDLAGNTDVDSLANKARILDQPVFAIRGKVQKRMPPNFTSVYPGLLSLFRRGKTAARMKKQARIAQAKVASGMQAVKHTVARAVSKVQGSRVNKDAPVKQKTFNRQIARAMIQDIKKKIEKTAGVAKA